MSLVVENGTGLSTAEAYASVSEATAYLAKFGITNFVDTAATGSLTIATQPSNGDTVSIGDKTYTFQSSLTNVDGNVLIGSSLSQTQANLRNAVNLTGTPGTGYAAATTANEQCSFGAWSSNTSVVTALEAGESGNLIETSSVFVSANNGFAADELSGGVNTTEIALRKSARWMDGNFKWRGYRKNEDQALDWPRSIVEDRDGYLISDITVPTKVKQAAILAAYKSHQGSELEPDVTDSSQLMKDLVKVGPITIEKQYQGGKAFTSQSIYTEIENLLSDLTLGNGLVRG